MSNYVVLLMAFFYSPDIVQQRQRRSFIILFIQSINTRLLKYSFIGFYFTFIIRTLLCISLIIYICRTCHFSFLFLCISTERFYYRPTYDCPYNDTLIIKNESLLRVRLTDQYETNSSNTICFASVRQLIKELLGGNSRNSKRVDIERKLVENPE